jgi:hypothetical protein
MVVYLHISGIKLKFPGYAKTVSLGLLSDMDIGIAELEYIKDNFTSAILFS